MSGESRDGTCWYWKPLQDDAVSQSRYASTFLSDSARRSYLYGACFCEGTLSAGAGRYTNQTRLLPGWQRSAQNV